MEKQKIKQEQGITLIALIISIIIMVILAVVSINSIYNMAIVEKATNGVQQYAQKAVEENQMMDSITSLIGDTTKRLAALQEEVPDLLKRYVMGADGTGRNIFEIFNGVSLLPDTDSITNPNEVIVMLNVLMNDYKEPYNENYFYIKYDNVAYKVITDHEYDPEKYNAIGGHAFTTKGIEVVYVPTGMEGQIVGFKVDQDEETVSNWLVLYDNGNTVDMVSMETMGNYQFNASATNVNDGINSYNNAVSILNTYCSSLIDNKDAQKVRSVGTKFELTDTRSKYTSTFLANNPTGEAGNYNGKGLVGDLNCEQDVVRMSYYPTEGHVGYGYSYTGNEYWLASRYVNGSSDSVSFDVRRVLWDGSANNSDYVWGVFPVSAYNGSFTLPVRPVVRVEKSKLLAPSSD